MKKFLTYTVGLNCYVPTDNEQYNIRMVKVAIYDIGEYILLQAVSGNNLDEYPHNYSKAITKDEFENRPTENVDLAVWALAKVGLEASQIQY